MQGKLILSIFLSATMSAGAFAADSPRRQPCQRVEQPPQRQQTAPQQQVQRKAKPQGCTIVRTIPAVVDPTPVFLL